MNEQFTEDIEVRQFDQFYVEVGRIEDEDTGSSRGGVAKMALAGSSYHDRVAVASVDYPSRPYGRGYSYHDPDKVGLTFRWRSDGPEYDEAASIFGLNPEEARNLAKALIAAAEHLEEQHREELMF